jgi:RNA polymerase sigma-70 factor (ECF subfamily)
MTEAHGGDAAGSLAEMLDERQHLLEIALWIFGSATTADRIVQETYHRWYALHDDERAAIAVPRAWLTRVAGGICIDLLASAATAQAPVIPPEPSSATAPVVLSDRGGLVQPAPLHQASDLDTRPVQRRPHRPRSTQTMLSKHARVVRRFAAACESRDIAALQAVLAPDAVVVSDGGGKVRAAARPVHGASETARVVAAVLAGQAGTLLTVESVNGRMGLVLRRAGQAVAVVSLSVAGSEVTAVWVVLNPDKLRSWHRS